MVRGKQNAWDPQICLSWGETFLAWINSNVVEAGNGDSPPPPGSVWRVKFTPRVGAQFALLQEEERREVEAGGDRVGFLPKWYWREVMQDVTGWYDSSASGVQPEPSRSSASAPTPSASAPTALPPGWQI
jgi:RAT1-interacting protein